jgi:hypothetical protein
VIKETKKNGIFETNKKDIGTVRKMKNPLGPYYSLEFIPAIIFRDNPASMWTGVNDRKKTKKFPDGEKIYGGDIIQFGSDQEWFKGDGERGVICWDSGYAIWSIFFFSIYGGEGYIGHDCNLKYYLYSFRNTGWRLIGNIWDNPELLKSKKVKL